MIWFARFLRPWMGAPLATPPPPSKFWRGSEFIAAFRGMVGIFGWRGKRNV